MNKTTNRTKKMDLTDRAAIELGLCRGEKLVEIANKIGRYTQSVAREVKANRTFVPGVYSWGNDCKYVSGCNKTSLCGDVHCPMYCYTCSKNCHQFCELYVSTSCHKPQKPPYVCNSCPSRKTCSKDRYFYSAKYAQSLSFRRNSEAHTGIHLSDDEFDLLNRTITAGVKRGQPIDHICASNTESVPVCTRSVYNYIDRGIMTVKNVDLRRKSGYKHRRKHRDPSLYQQRCRVGRTYQDYLKYMEDKSPEMVTEMDTVKGARGTGSVLLTMFLRRNSVMLIFVMPDGTQASVKRCFNFLEEGLGLETFKRLFPTILTDNGAEFKGVDELEMTSEGFIRTNIFYCDPMASGQKGRIEKNHEYIRYVLPKGSSFNGYSQNEMVLLMNHINSTRRKGLGFQSPYDLIPRQDMDMKKLMRLMKLEIIPDELVNLTPTLLRSIK